MKFIIYVCFDMPLGITLAVWIATRTRHQAARYSEYKRERKNIETNNKNNNNSNNNNNKQRNEIN